jgi:hypothetical protein
MGSMTLHPAVEVQRLVDAGLLTKDIAYRFYPEAKAFLSFSNRIDGRLLRAEISYDAMQSDRESLELQVTEEIDGQELEVVSIYRHSSLEHLVRTGRGFLCYHASKSRSGVKRKSTVTIRVDEDLRRAFEAAAGAIGESQAVVLRQLMRYFVGTGPNPNFGEQSRA